MMFEQNELFNSDSEELITHVRSNENFFDEKALLVSNPWQEAGNGLIFNVVEDRNSDYNEINTWNETLVLLQESHATRVSLQSPPTHCF